MSKLDLKKFKKVSEDKHHTVLSHSDGHEIRIVHSALSPKMREQLKSLPTENGKKMADGGQVDNSNSSAAQVSKGAQESGTLSEGVGNIKKYFQNKAEGGKVQDTDEFGYPKSTPEQQKKIPGGPGSPAFDPTDHPTPKPEAKGGTIRRYAQGTDAGPIGSPADDSQQDPNSVAPAQAMGQAYGQAYGLDPTPQAPQPIPVPQDPVGAAYASQYNNDLAAAQGKSPDQVNPGAADTTPADPGAPSQGGAATNASNGNPMSDVFGGQAAGIAQGYNQSLAGIAGQRNAEAAIAQQSAGQLAKQQTDNQILLQDYQRKMKDVTDEINDHQAALKNAGINPTQYVDNMSTGKELRTGLGLLLSGFGSGGSGQPNLAYEMLQNNINRDIEAQKADLGKKQNLLSFAYQKYGNINEAANMVRAIHMQNVQAALQEIAAKQGGNMATARALQAAGPITREMANNTSQIALRRTMLSGLASGTVQPAQAVEFLITDPDAKAAARKELTAAMSSVKARDNALDGWNQVLQSKEIGHMVANPLRTISGAQAAQLNSAIARNAHDTAGRYNEDEAKSQLKQFGVGLTDTAKDVQLKHQAYVNYLGQQMNYPTLNAWGIDPTRFGKYNSEGGSPLKIAPAKLR